MVAIIDTNIVVDYIKNIEIVNKLVDRYETLYMPVIVSGELIFGAINSPNPNREISKYEMFVERCQILEINEKVAEKYAEIRLELKKKGKPIPENDIWIGAICIANELPLITQDRHFQNIEQLNLILPS